MRINIVFLIKKKKILLLGTICLKVADLPERPVPTVPESNNVNAILKIKIFLLYLIKKFFLAC